MGVPVTDHSDEETYLGINGVAARLGCSPSAVRSWEEQGRIPPAGRVAGTGHRIWRLAEIDAFTGSEQTARRRDRRQTAIAR